MNPKETVTDESNRKGVVSSTMMPLMDKQNYILDVTNELYKGEIQLMAHHHARLYLRR